MTEDERQRHKLNQARYVINYHLDGRELPHGKVWCYSKLGCRCDDCRKAIRAHQRKYELAKKAKVAQ